MYTYTYIYVYTYIYIYICVNIYPPLFYAFSSCQGSSYFATFFVTCLKNTCIRQVVLDKRFSLFNVDRVWGTLLHLETGHSWAPCKAP